MLGRHNKDNFERDMVGERKDVPYLPNVHIFTPKIMAQQKTEKVKLHYEMPGFGLAGDVVEVTPEDYGALVGNGMAERSQDEVTSTENAKGYTPPPKRQEDSSYPPDPSDPEGAVTTGNVKGNEPVTKQEKFTQAAKEGEASNDDFKEALQDQAGPGEKVVPPEAPDAPLRSQAQKEEMEKTASEGGEKPHARKATGKK